MPAAADVTEAADVEGEEPIESVSTENAPADEGSVPAASSAFRIRRRRRRMASRATLKDGQIAGISIGSIVGVIVLILGARYLYNMNKGNSVGGAGTTTTFAPVEVGSTGMETVSAVTNLFS